MEDFNIYYAYLFYLVETVYTIGSPHVIILQFFFHTTKIFAKTWSQNETKFLINNVRKSNLYTIQGALPLVGNTFNMAAVGYWLINSQ